MMIGRFRCTCVSHPDRGNGKKSYVDVDEHRKASGKYRGVQGRSSSSGNNQIPLSVRSRLAQWQNRSSSCDTQPLPGGTRSSIPCSVSGNRAGRVVEEMFNHQVPVGTTQAQIEAQVQTIYPNLLAIFNGRPNPNQFYGLAWDGTVWA